MTGRPYWIQHGQVMTFFVQSGTAPQAPPRKTYTNERPAIANNDFYMLDCQDMEYVPDEACFYTCKDGVIDTTTYCRQDPQGLCKLIREEATVNQQCPLDFDSDEPFHDGKSLKAWWQEILDVYHFGIDELFSFNSSAPFFLGHGAANLAGLSWIRQHVEILDFMTPLEFDASSVEFTAYVDKGYNYGNDTLSGSTSAGQSGYLQDLVTENYPDNRFPGITFNLPKVTAPVPGFNP